MHVISVTVREGIYPCGIFADSTVKTGYMSITGYGNVEERMHYTLITPHEEFTELIGMQRIQEGNVSYKGRNYKIISTHRLILYVVPTYSFEVNHILT